MQASKINEIIGIEVLYFDFEAPPILKIGNSNSILIRYARLATDTILFLCIFAYSLILLSTLTMSLLQNKIILITGASSGIGWKCAEAYMRAGARVIIADINEPEQKQKEVLTANRSIWTYCDLRKEHSVRASFELIREHYQKLDAIHNNAGLASPSLPLHQTSDMEWESLMNTNLRSILYTSRHGIELLKESRGCILNTGSMAATLGQENHAAYVATKGAIDALTRSMALDYAADGIRVNAILPAAVSTPMLERWIQEQRDSGNIRNFLDRLQPLGKMPEGDVIADAAVFLLSDMARFITGCSLPVGGGAELGYRTLLR